MSRTALAFAALALGLTACGGGADTTIRRTAASLLHGSGKTGRQLADWLGHHDPAFSVRTYVGTMDEGLGDATFLDELIPVEGGQSDGQSHTRTEPNQDGSEDVENPHASGGDGAEPNRAEPHEAVS